MKKLLLICLVIFSCKTKIQERIKDQSAETKKVDTLKVDQSLFSDNEKQYLKTIDSLASAIDSENQFVRSVNARTTLNNIESEIKLDGYSETEGGIVNKLVASVKNQKQDIIYRYYYLNGKTVKVASDVRDYPPFYSSVYFQEDNIFKPKELSIHSAEAARAQSASLLLTYFK
jgi:hypothetical protein